MYVHIGNNRLVRQKDIIGIFDLDTATIEQTTRRYLADSDKAGQVITVKNEIPKAFVLTKNKDGKKIYMTQLASQTIIGRTEKK